MSVLGIVVCCLQASTILLTTNDALVKNKLTTWTCSYQDFLNFTLILYIFRSKMKHFAILFGLIATISAQGQPCKCI